ncbi:hypothetical protein [Butyrivibrio sp. FCS014]|uniref:hypothetical protein n=1 Tax=Butyrivibrio sp. FCS014 TaxID=1408304 RepID=UPI0004665EA2|nr:hypothetical protein [Butyrivibrio sp. FCS014]
MRDSKLFKWLILAVLVIYVVSPADLLPGPVDDVIAILLYLAANRNDFRINKKDDDIEVIDVDGREI